MDLNTSGIYKITAPSGRSYIGSAVNFRRRWNGHKTRLRNNRHHCPGLQQAALKYGLDSLVFSIVELVPRDRLLHREQEYLDANWTQLYNCVPKAGSTYGFAPTQQTRDKISNALQGLKRSPETKARMAAAQTGKSLSVATRLKISLVQIGRKQSQATVKKRANALRGIVHKDNSTGYPGVGKFRNGFRARWRNKHLGVFATAEAAHLAVCEARNGQ